MTKLAVSIMVRSTGEAHAAAAKAAEHGADLAEYRIDQFTSDHTALRELVEASPLPCIITCRPVWEGGQYEGDDDARLAALEAACGGVRHPAYLDVELVAWQRSDAFRRRIKQLVDGPGQARQTDTGLILSSHDFDSRPTDLLQRVEAMAADPTARVIKVAWRARSLRDNLEAFEILLQRHKPTIALCMGEEGLPSRVLAKKFGALLTFAALDASSNTAPGQPTIADLKRKYLWDQLRGDVRVFGVIGDPVGHSMSPAVHNAGFDATGFNGVYLPLRIPPEYEHFKATVSTWLAMPELHFRGASVTIPHKENLLRFVREQGGSIEPLAEQIGAANTLTVRDDGSLFASNSDYAGALDAVCDGMGITREALAGKRVAVIGAGGAARAIVAGFANYGATVVVYNRTTQKAEALAEQFNGKTGKVVAARLEKLCDSCCEVFINCTPIGMHPNVDASPIPAAADTKGWGAGAVVFDTVYNPLETKLLRDAKAAGCTVVPGTEMFTRQAAAQFEQWTDTDAPLDVFNDVLLTHLRAKGQA